MRSGRVDLVIVVVVMGLAVLGIFDAVGFRNDAKLLPLLTLFTLIGLCAVFIVGSLLHKAEEGLISIPFLRILIIVAMCLLYGYFLETLGFFVSSVAFFMAVIATFDRSRFVKSIFVSVGLVAMVYAVFSFGFGVYLPVGEVFG